MTLTTPHLASRSTAFTVLAAALMLLSTFSSLNVRAEIPHENYDLVQSDLDVLIGILNSTIVYSEYALDSMYYENMGSVEQNLSVVRGLLAPAEQLLLSIEDVADSYENLSRLLPPFADLSALEDSFASMEVSLLSARDDIVSASQLANLTGDQMLQAIEAISRVSSLIWQMNNTIDDMLVSAYEIIALEIDGRQPFAENDLIPLIERLRELLNIILAEIDQLIHDEEGGVPWSEDFPFLLLWLGTTQYYLGESIYGGGYLYFNGSFAPYHEVQLLMDGENLTTAVTASDGEYRFSHEIPMNASWLGPHTIQAMAYTPNGTLSSGSIAIQIAVIPTRIVLSASATLLTYEDQLTVSARLYDVRGLPVESGACNITVDSETDPFETDAAGSYSRTWNASDLDYGTHTFQAFYTGEIPYGPCSSNAVTVVIDIPTMMTVKLVQTRIFVEYTIIGNGTLYANGTTPLPGKEVTISIDGIELINVTTDENGGFVFTYDASLIGTGGHTLKAAFSHREYIWRYSQAEIGFSTYPKREVAYPFFPSIPGWGGFGPPETFPELFIGDYAYYTWLLILATLAIIIRILQVRKTSRKAREGVELTGLGSDIHGATLGETGMPLEAKELTFDMLSVRRGSTSPNDAIVWYYHSMMEFLRRKRSIAIRPSMTHWELAKMLRSLGYPADHVKRVTVLFEQALYSGAELTESDILSMSISLGSIVRTREWGVSRAV